MSELTEPTNLRVIMTLEEAEDVAEMIEKDSENNLKVRINKAHNMRVVYTWGILSIRTSSLSQYEAYKKALMLEDESEFLRPNLSDISV